MPCNSCSDDVPFETEGCIDGGWYGPCGSEFCGGICEYKGDCPCQCHKAA